MSLAPRRFLLGLFTVVLVAVGALLIAGGVWLMMDFWSWSWYNPYQLSPETWRFCSPGYWICVTPANASYVMDVGIGFVILGVLLSWFGVFTLGFYIRSRSWPM